MRGSIVAALVLFTATTHADDGLRATADPPSRHLVVAELLGKGGFYSLGYEYTIAPWLSAGGALSFSEHREQQVFTASPYLHLTLLAGDRHALFSEVGAILAHSRIPSPVMGWGGVADTGGGGFASLGWEYRRRHVVLRTSGALAVGEGGAAPMLGFAIGARP